MTTFHGGRLFALALRAIARTAVWGLPWLAMFAISASVAYGMTASLTAGDAAPRAEQAPLSREACDTSTNLMLVYALSTHRVPDSSLEQCQR